MSLKWNKKVSNFKLGKGFKDDLQMTEGAIRLCLFVFSFVLISASATLCQTHNIYLCYLPQDVANKLEKITNRYGVLTANILKFRSIKIFIITTTM